MGLVFQSFIFVALLGLPEASVPVGFGDAGQVSAACGRLIQLLNQSPFEAQVKKVDESLKHQVPAFLAVHRDRTMVEDLRHRALSAVELTTTHRLKFSQARLREAEHILPGAREVLAFVVGSKTARLPDEWNHLNQVIEIAEMRVDGVLNSEIQGLESLLQSFACGWEGE